MGEEDITKKEENRWRRCNSFSTIEIVDEAEGLVFARFLVFESWESVKFQGFNRESWPLYLSERYGCLLIEAISTYCRKKETSQLLQEWLAFATLEEIDEQEIPIVTDSKVDE